MNVDALEVQVAGVGAVGLVVGTRFVTAWLRMLLNIDGRNVLWLASCVALFQVVAFALTQTTWEVLGFNVADGAAWAAVGLYITCLLGSTASAVYEMERNFKVAGSPTVDEPATEPHWSGR